MTTTKKEFKAQIQDHILYGLSEDYSQEPKEQLQNVVNEFKNWYGTYEQKRTPNREEAFTDWLLCLPGVINTEFTHHGINQTLQTWFENMGETYKERDTDKEASLYYHLVYREFNTLLKKNGVELF